MSVKRDDLISGMIVLTVIIGLGIFVFGHKEQGGRNDDSGISEKIKAYTGTDFPQFETVNIDRQSGFDGGILTVQCRFLDIPDSLFYNTLDSLCQVTSDTGCREWNKGIYAYEFFARHSPENIQTEPASLIEYFHSLGYSYKTLEKDFISFRIRIPINQRGWTFERTQYLNPSRVQ